MNRVTLINGDVLAGLKGMADEPVHCVVTSPPYYGLRDYGIKPVIWGRAEGCRHEWGPGGGGLLHKNRNFKRGTQEEVSGSGPLVKVKEEREGGDSFCYLCVAWRGSLGLEPTIELFIEHMVEIFREVRRVLRPDGVLFLNLGSSYYGGGGAHKEHHANPGLSKSFDRGGVLSFYGKQPNQSLPDAHPCDSDDIEQSDSQVSDHACCHSGDECQDGSQNHLDRTSHSGPQPPVSGGHLCMKDHDRLPGGCAASLPGVLPLSVPGSTMPGFWLQLRAGCSHLDNPFSCPSFSGSCFPAIQEYAHKKASPCESQINAGEPTGLSSHIYDTGQTGGASNHHTKDIASGSFSLSQPPIVQAYHTIKFKSKDLLMVPAMVALALQADGWWLRSDIIWAKPNPMPESCTDRPTKAHEYTFLLTKSAKYFWDTAAVREQNIGRNDHDLTGPGYNPPGQSRQSGNRKSKMPDGWDTGAGGHSSIHRNGREAGAPNVIRSGRNLRSVWTIATASFPEAHFATYPPELVRRCVAAGSKEGDTILDPFSGAGTTAMVAAKLGRNAIGIELNPEYVEMSRKRIVDSLGMLAAVEVKTSHD